MVHARAGTPLGERRRRRATAVGVALLALTPVGMGAPPAGATAEPTIETVAGGPTEGQATSIGMRPLSVAFYDGDLFVVDGESHTVRRVDLTTGEMTLAAGVGGLGSRLDTPDATEAVIDPRWIAFDGGGRMLLTDGHHLVERVTPDGVLEVVAPVPNRSTFAEGGIAVEPDGSALLAVGPELVRLTPEGSTSTVATGLGWGMGVARHADGRVDVADYSAGVVRRIAPDGTTSVVASGLSFPTGIAVDAQGRLLIAESIGERVVRLEPDGSLTTVASGLSGPQGLAVDPATGAIAIADIDAPNSAGVVRLLSPDGQVRVVAGNGSPSFSGDGGPAIDAQLSHPSGIVVAPNGDVYVADRGDHRVRKISADGRITTVAGDGVQAYGGDGGPAVRAHLCRPNGLALDGAGNLYIADGCSYRVRRVGTDGRITTVAGGGAASGDLVPATSAQLAPPVGVAVDRLGSVYFSEGHRVRRVLPGGTIVTVAGTGAAGATGDGGLATLATLDHPAGVAVDALGRLFIADSHNGRVRVVSPVGIISTYLDASGTARQPRSAIGTGFDAPYGITIDPAGNLVVTAPGSARVVRVLGDGSVEKLVGTLWGSFGGDGGPALEARVSSPQGVAVDPSGTLWVSDAGNGRVRAVRTIDLPPASPLDLVPTSPLGVSVVDGDGHLSVSWGPPATDGGAPVTAYVVVATAGGHPVGWASVAGDVRTTSLAGLTNDLDHQVLVVAISGNGWGLASAPVTGRPSSGEPDPVPADDPTVLEVLPGDGFATVAWAPPGHDGGSPITAYSLIAVGRGDGRLAGWVNLGADVRRASVPGLRPGDAYTVHVLAWTALGPGTFGSADVEVPTTGLLARATPSAPSGVVTQATPTGISVGWSPTADDGGSPVLGHSVVALQGGRVVAWVNVGPHGRRVRVTGFDPAAPVTIYVLAMNALGFSVDAVPATVWAGPA